MDGRRRRVSVVAARGKKRKTSFTEPKTNEKPPSKLCTTSRGALSTQQRRKARRRRLGRWRPLAWDAPRARSPYGGYPAAADKTSKGKRTYRHVLVPLPVAAHDVVALLLEPLREVRRDEAARAGDADLQLLLGPVRLGAVNPAQVVAGGGHLKLVLRLAILRLFLLLSH